MRFARDKQSNALDRHSLLDQRIGPRPRLSDSSAQLNSNTRSATQVARPIGTGKRRSQSHIQCKPVGHLPPRAPSPAGKRDLKPPAPFGAWSCRPSRVTPKDLLSRVFVSLFGHIREWDDALEPMAPTSSCEACSEEIPIRVFPQ